MSKNYSKADESILTLIDDVMSQFHPELKACGLKVDCLLEGNYHEDEGLQPSLKLHGYPCAATIQIIPLKRRALGEGDVLITIDEYGWKHSLGDREKVATIDHELQHVVIVGEPDEPQTITGPKGKIKVIRAPRPEGGWRVEWDANAKTTTRAPALDDQYRPKCRMRLHDWQLGGFEEIAERHGSAALEVQGMKIAFNKHGQSLLFGENDGTAVEVVEVPRKRAQAGRAA